MVSCFLLVLMVVEIMALARPVPNGRGLGSLALQAAL